MCLVLTKELEWNVSELFRFSGIVECAGFDPSQFETCHNELMFLSMAYVILGASFLDLSTSLSQYRKSILERNFIDNVNSNAGYKQAVLFKSSTVQIDHIHSYSGSDR